MEGMAQYVKAHGILSNVFLEATCLHLYVYAMGKSHEDFQTSSWISAE